MKYKYKSLTEFNKAHPNLYQQLHKRNELDRLCRDMGWERKNVIKKPHNYWTKERCIEEAKKYKSCTEFAKKNGGAYQAALRNNWWLECISIFHSKHIIKAIITQRDEYKYTFKHIAENLNSSKNRTKNGKLFTTSSVYRIYKLTNK